MNKRITALSTVFFLGAVATAEAEPPAEISRGEYLINRLSPCGDCHTPRDDRGRPVAGKELAGAPFPGGPPNDANFAHYAPAIAGLPPSRSKADVSMLLQTGHYLDGHAVRPPMPPFRWSKKDADAGAEYLASLNR